jgi:hypothetical protein
MWALYKSHHKKYALKRKELDNWVKPPKIECPDPMEAIREQTERLALQGYHANIEMKPSLIKPKKEIDQYTVLEPMIVGSNEDIQESSSEEGTDIYESVKALTNELHVLAENQVEESIQAQDSFVFDQEDEIDSLKRDTSDICFRKAMQQHSNPSPEIQQAIEMHRVRSPFRDIQLKKHEPIEMSQ